MTTALANRVMLGLLPSDWETRMTSTRRIYFVDHITRTTMWEDPWLPVNGRGRRRCAAVLSAEDRLLPELPLIANAKCDVCVHRRWVFEDSFVATMRLRPGDLRKRLMGKFEGEDAVDYGGVSREWFLAPLARNVQSTYGLFKYSAHDNYMLQINRASSPEYLDDFKFINRVLGLTVFHHRFLDAYFVLGFYKMVLNKR